MAAERSVDFPDTKNTTASIRGEEAVSPYLWSRGFQKLDVVALAHAHQDHLGSLTAIPGNFRIARLWIGREVSVPALVRLEELARERKISIEHELRGKSFRWDGVEGEFLWPEIAPEEVAPSAQNNDSLVLRLRYGNETLLLPGDAEKQVELHGSKNSTTPEFLGAVQPRVGIICAGEDNPYGHPSPELLERLENAGIRILRTDRNRAVQVMADGRQLEISCFVACPNNGNAAASVQAKAPDRKQD
jgi:competence protein ComEC